MKSILLSQQNLNQNDALLVVDIQNDFLPSGSLAIAQGNHVIAPMNRMIHLFESKNLPIFFTRDWHPNNHCSFHEHKGIWPSHCIQNTYGAEFSPLLYQPKSMRIISKATSIEKDAYSGFEATNLHQELKALHISRVFIGGLATDYCVLSTIRDASKLGYKVYVILDGIKGVNVKPEDEQNALQEMENLGVLFITTESN